MRRLQLLAVISLAIFGAACDSRDREHSDPALPASIAKRPQLGTAREALVTTTTLEASGDTYLRSATPNQNAGGDTALSLQSLGRRRALLFFTPSSITAAVGSGTLLAARVELTLAAGANNWSPSGRSVAIHRLKQASAEYQATWNCALDANINNLQDDCQGATAWSMSSGDPALQPWLSPASATRLITNNQTGVVSFDVTADVAAILAGSYAGHGWLIKKVDENQAGSLDFVSREQGPGPRLLLDIDGAPSGGGGPGPVVGSASVTASSDNYVRQLEPNQNFGTASGLRITAVGRNRALVAFNPAAVTGALGGPLARARLRLPIGETASNWGPDRALGAHRLLQAWSESGATWNCSLDSNTGNLSADCSGASAWTMFGASSQAPWVNPPVDTTLVSNGQTGTLELDVTRDVACGLAGFTPLNGWIIKKEMENQGGRMELRSRETSTPPTLFLEWTNTTGVVVNAAACNATEPPPNGCTPSSTVDTSCNGIDDDCDGQIDDDFTATDTACGVGACAAAGSRNCVAGQVVDSCQPGAAAASDSSCNGIDDDCNGAIDEDYVGLPTSCGVGACSASGLTECVQGQVVEDCQPAPPAANDTTCDGIDNDCDGTTDEDYTPVATSCGIGACAAGGTTSCVSGQVVDSCAPRAPAPADATCDLVDDDCDGIVDEDFPTTLTSCGIGACSTTGSTSCILGAVVDSCQPGTPAAVDATCNGIDEDCNGSADEDYVSVATSCGTGSCTGTGTTSCANGSVVSDCHFANPSDGNPCTDDSCDGSGTPVFTARAAGTACADGNVCNGAELCNGTGSCQAGVPLATDDGNPCTIDSCDPGLGVQHTAAADGSACSDGDACTQSDSCQQGSCAGANPVLCSALDQCHEAGVCNPGTGACSQPARSDGSPCDDHDACTQSDSCQQGSCAGANPVLCSALDQCHEPGVCNSNTGVCSNPARLDGSLCSDGNACTQGDSCASGACAAGGAVTLDDANPCTADACDPVQGVSHTPVPAGTSCADTNPCNGAEACNETGTCTPQPPPNLDDGDVCTIDSCDPASGVQHDVIPGCDSSPTVAGGRFETRASVLGRVLTRSGAAVTNFDVQVYDAPIEGDARADVELTTGNDGSFRARLSEFPELFAETTPSQHLVIRVITSDFIPVLRDVYVRPGDAIDLGRLYLLDRDPQVTLIGPAGGVARDSQSAIEISFPPGAVLSTTPVRITPVPERQLFPYPLPDATDTTYGMVLEPSQQFAAPVTVRVANRLNVPTSLQIPVGVVDEQNGGWNHETFGIWNGSAFAFNISHFSTIDLNTPNAGQLYMFETAGADPSKAADGNCAGSNVSYGNGALRQTFALPTYRRQGREYGVTFTYDSSLTGGHRLGTAPASKNGVATGGSGTSGGGSGSGGVHARGIALSVSGPTISFACIGRGGSGGGGCATGSSCTTGSIRVTPYRQQATLAGTEFDSEGEATGTAINAISSAFYVELPLNPDGSVPAPDYFPYQRSVTLRAPIASGGGGGNCSGGGAVFGVQASVQTPLATNLVPGPLARSQGYELLYHRRSSPEGTGWGISEVHEAFRAPNLAQIDLVHGDGRRESFFPRIDPDVVGAFSAAILARDPETGELFNLSGSVSRINADWSVTAATPSLGLTNPRALAVDYADTERRFFIATATGLFEADAGGVRGQLASWTSQSTTFNRPRVAAGGGAVYFTDGSTSVIRRILLNDPLRAVQSIGLASGGDVRVNPTVPAGQISFDTPRGLAMSPDGSLYVACPRRHMVYRLSPADDGWVGPQSEVERVLGSGMGSYSAARGGQEVALSFGMNQPLDLSFSDDGFLFVMNTEGLVRFDPLNGMARWFANEREQGLTLQVDGTPAFVALDRDHALVFDTSLALLSGGDWASEFEPRRRIHDTATGLSLVDTGDDVVENYDWIDQTHTHARMTSRAARTGEPLLSVGYTAVGKVAFLQDPTGGRFTFDYDGFGRLTSIEDAAGRTTHVSVDDANNLRELELPTGEARQFEYDGHLMTSATDPRGERTSYVYRDNGTVERVTRPGGASRQFSPAFGAPTYNAGQLVRQGNYTDDRGVAHTIQVDEAGQLIVDQFVADGVSYDLRQIYHGNLTGAFHEDRLNKALKIARVTLNGTQLTPTNSWDAFGRLTRISTPSSGTGIASPGTRWSLSYGADDRLSLTQPGVGNTQHRYQRDANGRLSRIQDAFSSSNTLQGRHIDFAWRSDGQLQTRTDHTTPRTYSYDASSGNLLGWSDATGALSFANDAAGNVTLRSDGATAISRTYDDSNRLTSVTDALGNVTTVGYENDSCGCARDKLVTSLITPDLPPGTNWRFEYDADGRLSRATDPDGFSLSYARTASGDVQSITDQLQRGTTYTYDQLGRPSTVRDPAGRLGVYAYPVPVSPAWNGPMLYAGSPNLQPAPTDLVTSLGPGQYQIGYNALPSGDGRPQIDLYRDATFALSYGNSIDRMGRVDKRRDRTDLPISSSTVFGAQAAGNFMHSLYAYDIRSERPMLSIVESDYPEESRYEPATFTFNDYFDVTNMDGFGTTSRYSVVGDGDTFTRDTSGRITGLAQRFLTRPASGVASVLYQPPASTYGYNANGYLNLINNGSGIQNITYDARGLRSTVDLSFQAPATITEGTFHYDYDELGRSVYLQFPDGHVRRQVFDTLGRLTSRCYEYGGSLGTRCYTAEYDPVGNPIALMDPEGMSLITYDDLDRVSEVRRQVTGQPDEVESYTYNALGGFSFYRTASMDDQRPRLDGLGAAPAALPATNQGLPVTLDAGGRLSALNGATMVHNKQTRLRDVTEGGVTYRMGYDALQRRIGFQRTGSPAEAYQYESGNIVSVVNATGLAGVQRRIFYDGTDHPLWMYDNINDLTVYFELDAVGNVRRLRGGHLVAPRTAAPPSDLGGYRYSAFGKLYPADAGTPAPTLDGAPYDQPFRWQGRPFINLAGGLYDFRARMWSPELGAFLEVDDFAHLDTSGTLWSWPGQNPFRFGDPTGRGARELAAGFGAALGGAAGFTLGGGTGLALSAGTAGLGLGATPALALGGAAVGTAAGAAFGASLYDATEALADFAQGLLLANDTRSDDRKALDELRDEAMEERDGELTRPDAETLKEWAREVGTKGEVHDPHEDSEIDFPHAHIGTKQHIPICE